MGVVRGVQLCGASGANIDRGILRPAKNGVRGKRDVGCGAQGACHVGRCRWDWWGMEGVTLSYLSQKGATTDKLTKGVFANKDCYHVAINELGFMFAKPTN